MKRIVHIDPMLRALIMAGAMTFASPAVAATVANDSSVPTVVDENASSVDSGTPEQIDSADNVGNLKTPEVVDPDAEGVENVSVSETRLPEADIEGIRTPEVQDPEVQMSVPSEVETPDVHVPDVNVPDVQTPEVHIPDVEAPGS